MSAPVTIVVLDHNAASRAQLRKFAESPDRIVVDVPSIPMARHALSTMAVALFVCDYSVGQEEIRSLVTIAQFASPKIRMVMVAPKLAEGHVADLCRKIDVPYNFVAKPLNGITFRNTLSAALQEYVKSLGTGTAAPKAAASGRTLHLASGRTISIQKVGEAAAAPAAAQQPNGPDPNNYDIVGVLGKGGTGTVFDARDKFLGTEVALKVINRDLLAKEGVMDSFRDEARITMQLTHRNILRLYNFRNYHECYYIVMEVVHGKSLRSLILENGCLSTKTTCQILAQCASALEYAHSHNVVHKDIKPDNVYLTDGGEVKIIDFGSAVLNDSMAQEEGVIVGTPEYMCPEQIRGELVGPTADQYALAIMTYLMLLGCFPYPATTTMQNFLDGVRPDFSAVPPELAAVLDKATSPSPDDRYASTLEFVNDVISLCGCEEDVANPYMPIEVVSGRVDAAS